MKEIQKYIENLEDVLNVAKYISINTTHYTEKRSKRLGIVLDPDEYSEFNPDIIEQTFYQNQIECFENVEEALDFGGQVFERVANGYYIPYVSKIEEPVKTTKTVKVKAKIVKGTGFNK